MTISGSCLCGTITFEIDKAVGPMEHCHCTRCQKVSGSNSLVMVGVNTRDYRLLSGEKCIKTYAAPILYAPPNYHSTFCSNCGSPVPPPHPKGDWFEIPAGCFDDDPGIRPDKHIYVDFTPAWDRISDHLPQLTMTEVFELRTGKKVPTDFVLKTHASDCEKT